MKITKNNLNEVMFENQDARLLIEDVVTHTGASLYYYHDMEITVQRALDIWYKAMGAEEEEDRPVPLFDFSNRLRLVIMEEDRWETTREGLPDAPGRAGTSALTIYIILSVPRWWRCSPRTDSAKLISCVRCAAAGRISEG